MAIFMVTHKMYTVTNQNPHHLNIPGLHYNTLNYLLTIFQAKAPCKY